jgi:hypothetical protein
VPFGGLPERDAQMKRYELLDRRGAMRLAILPVPPRRRIVGSKRDDMVVEELQLHQLDLMLQFSAENKNRVVKKSILLKCENNSTKELLHI